MKKITRQVSMFLVIGILGFPATLQAKNRGRKFQTRKWCKRELQEQSQMLPVR